MVNMLCTLVGVAWSAFCVSIGECKSVGHSKEKNKKKNAATVKCDSFLLKLFLAKTDNGS
ncbi:hypothetical protein P3T76_005974 [Phytophthora citrophthora]|uniref:Crinkler effector protein N-terminal domain-containing protein n=1 Tax=Phytophthora citrophthora TaxID=4793 RepID=A0AAD9GPQ8_9STRA|nr:hypothetical protein P3T76_005974 [Phytophthora citrophthora]